LLSALWVLLSDLWLFRFDSHNLTLSVCDVLNLAELWLEKLEKKRVLKLDHLLDFHS
jgi:hypothetical protein